MRDWHVLVVEDDRYIWEIISRLLEHYGIQVDVAPDAEEALAGEKAVADVIGGAKGLGGQSHQLE